MNLQPQRRARSSARRSLRLPVVRRGAACFSSSRASWLRRGIRCPASVAAATSAAARWCVQGTLSRNACAARGAQRRRRGPGGGGPGAGRPRASPGAMRAAGAKAATRRYSSNDTRPSPSRSSEAVAAATSARESAGARPSALTARTRPCESSPAPACAPACALNAAWEVLCGRRRARCLDGPARRGEVQLMAASAPSARGADSRRLKAAFFAVWAAARIAAWASRSCVASSRSAAFSCFSACHPRAQAPVSDPAKSGAGAASPEPGGRAAEVGWI